MADVRLPVDGADVNCVCVYVRARACTYVCMTEVRVGGGCRSWKTRGGGGWVQRSTVEVTPQSC